MITTPAVTDFLKALTDRDRLRIVGLLSGHPATLKQVADDLSLPIRKVYNHLEFLKFVHAVHIKEGLYHLDDAALQALSHRQLRGQIDALQNDPRTVERLARARLSFARTNETVFRFDAPPAR